MLYRVMGTKGSGKRAWLLNLAKKSYEEGKRVFVIVPEQATAQYERDLITLCGNACNDLVEVTNFSRLSNVVLRTYGSLARRGVTEEEKKLLLAATLKEKKPALSRLSFSATPAAVEALYGELEELRLAGVDSNALAELEEKGALSEELSQKLRELHLIRTSFEQKLSLRFDDPSEEEVRLARILEEYPFFRDAVVILDLFWDFTAPQKLLLKRMISQSAVVAVSLLVDFAKEEIFAKTIEAARNLLRLAKETNCPVEDVRLSPLPEEGEISFLREHLTEGKVFPEKKPEHIFLSSCENTQKECAWVAHTIGKMVREEEGRRWQDFAVFSRTGEEFTLLALALEEAGIPYFLEEKEPLAASLLAKTVILATRIASGDAREEVVRAYLSSALLACDEEERFLLEKYIATWAPRGRQLLADAPFVMNPDGYHTFHAYQRAELAAVNRAKKTVFGPLRDLSLALAKGKNEEKVSALVAFLGAIGTERILFSQMDRARKDGHWEEEERLTGMWNTVLERLSGIARAVGEEECSPEEFITLLTLALSGSLPGSIPSGQDRVQMGVLGFMRPHKAKHVFLMGLNAGVFPAPVPRGKVLTDGERTDLAKEGYPLSCGDRIQSEETFLFYLAISYAAENLFLSFVGEGGKQADNALSVFGKRVKNLFPKLETTPFLPEKNSPVFQEEAFRFFLENAGKEMPLEIALKEYFGENESFRKRLLHSLSGKAFSDAEVALKEEKPYQGENIRLSFTTLEKYIKCRFSYFAKYLLGAKETPTAAFGPNVTGTFIHRVLESILSDLASHGKTLSDLSDKELKEKNQEACREALEGIAAEIPQDATLHLLVNRIKRSSLLILKNLREEFSKSLFTPLFFEKKLDDAGGYSLPLPDGTQISFTGSIDRVDRYTGEDGRDYVRVVDYKTGSHSFSLEEVANGLDLQMLIYLYALWGKTLTKGSSPAQPAGILYLNGMEKATNCQSHEEVDEVAQKPFATLSREGLVVDDPELLSAQDPDGQGEYIPVGWNRKTKGGKVTVTGKANLVAMQDLGRLRKKNEEYFVKLATQIKDGIIAENPLYCLKKQIDECKYCQMLPICKRSVKSRRPYRTGLDREEIFGKEEKA